MIKIKRLKEYLIVTLMILSSKTVYFGLIYAKVTYVVLLLTLLLCFIGRGKLDISKKNIYFILWVASIALIQIFTNSDNMTSSFINAMLVTYIPFLCCFLVIQIIDKYSYTEKYSDVMFLICVISLICYAIAILNPALAQDIARSVNFNNSTYNISWYYTWGWGIHIFPRNSGPFWEPGAFQGFILIAFLFTIFNLNKAKLKKTKLSIFIITILTTGSTTGYILLGFVVLLFYKKIELAFIYSENKKYRNLLKIAFVFVAITSITYIFTSGNISEKLSGENISGLTRMNDFISSVKMIFDHPIAGYGFSSDRVNRLNELGVINDSVGMWSLLYTCGIPFGIIYIIKMIRGLRMMFESNKVETVILALIFIALHFTEAIWWLPVYIIFLFVDSGYNLKQRKLNQENAYDVIKGSY